MKIIVRESSCPYVPLNVECEGVFKGDKLFSCHRLDSGAGTFLNGYERVVWEEIV